MFEEYLKAILAACEKTRIDKTFTPGDFRNECINVFRERPLSNDDEALRLFFGATDLKMGFAKKIENSKADKYRQMPKLLKGDISNPNRKYIELLAWLIDFNPRPSTLYYQQPNNNRTANNPDISVPTEEEPGGQNSGELLVIDQDLIETDEQKNGELETIDQDTDKIVGQNPGDLEVIDHVIDKTGGQKTETGSLDENAGDQDKKTKSTKPIRTVVMVCTILFLVAGATFFFREKKTNIGINPILKSDCMYWTGDSYELIDCNEKVGNSSIIPLDTQKLNHLQKITSPDTLTKDALGKVWYTKIAGEHQFFTDSGAHPLDTQKKLKPLTRYILSNHVSYYRYLLTLVLWSICVIVSGVLCTAFLVSFRKRRKKKMLALTNQKMFA